MDFRELEYIVSIAKNQGVGKAAEECNVSQPTLSKFVQNLEYILGQPLFRRLGNKFLLTYAGEQYTQAAKIILEIKKELDQELSDIVQKHIGEIKMFFRYHGGTHMLPKMLSVFWNQFPRVKIKISDDVSDTPESELLNGDIDIAFTTIPIQHPNITREIINREELVLIMPPDHPMADKGIERPEYNFPWMDIKLLKDEAFILSLPNQRSRQMADKIFRDAGIKPNIRLTVRNKEIMFQLVAKRFGLAFVAQSLLHHFPADEKPVCFSVGNPAPEFIFTVAYRSDIYQPTYIKEFTNIVKKVFSASEDVLKV
jgi:DNA-binding transcriptional LysR family regulator